MSQNLLVVDQVTRTYALPREALWRKPPLVHALQGISFTLAAGRSLGVVGESGSGKSTLARLVMALEAPSSGRVSILGRDMAALNAGALRSARRDFQMVFQDPYGSLDPRQTVQHIVTEPLQAQGGNSEAEQRRLAQDVLASVGLRASDLDKYPHEFSGGQRQRIAIARALALEPRLLVADEPVSALDVSIQSQILNLLMELRRQHNMAMVFISHDLSVVRHISDDVAVMYFGSIVELAPAADIFERPVHPYTRLLLSSIPSRNKTAGAAQIAAQSEVAGSELPDPANPPKGCAFAARCPQAIAQCRESIPSLLPRRVSESARVAVVACHLLEVGGGQ